MSKTTVKPLGKNVLLRPEKPEQKTASGIVLPDNASGEKLNQGTVVAVGDDKAVTVKPRQKVIYARYSGTEVRIDGADYLIVKAEDILAVIG